MECIYSFHNVKMLISLVLEIILKRTLNKMLKCLEKSNIMDDL